MEQVSDKTAGFIQSPMGLDNRGFSQRILNRYRLFPKYPGFGRFLSKQRTFKFGILDLVYLFFRPWILKEGRVVSDLPVSNKVRRKADHNFQSLKSCIVMNNALIGIDFRMGGILIHTVGSQIPKAGVLFHKYPVPSIFPSESRPFSHARDGLSSTKSLRIPVQSSAFPEHSLYPDNKNIIRTQSRSVRDRSDRVSDKSSTKPFIIPVQSSAFPEHSLLYPGNKDIIGTESRSVRERSDRVPDKSSTKPFITSVQSSAFPEHSLYPGNRDIIGTKSRSVGDISDRVPDKSVSYITWPTRILNRISFGREIFGGPAALIEHKKPDIWKHRGNRPYPVSGILPAPHSDKFTSTPMSTGMNRPREGPLILGKRQSEKHGMPTGSSFKRVGSKLPAAIPALYDAAAGITTPEKPINIRKKPTFSKDQAPSEAQKANAGPTGSTSQDSFIVNSKMIGILNREKRFGISRDSPIYRSPPSTTENASSEAAMSIYKKPDSSNTGKRGLTSTYEEEATHRSGMASRDSFIVNHRTAGILTQSMDVSSGDLVAESAALTYKHLPDISPMESITPFTALPGNRNMERSETRIQRSAPVIMELANVQEDISRQIIKKKMLMVDEEVPSPLTGQSTTPVQPDMDLLTDQIYQMLEKKIRIEKERRGI